MRGNPGSNDLWREIFALFEQWQSMDVEAREAWTAQMRAERPDIYPGLSEMIQADASAEAGGFLAGVAITEIPAASAYEAKWSETCLGSWILKKPIGSGGMGHVWLATRADRLYTGRAAVKLLNAANAGPDADARFAREGEFLSRLAHPRIAQLYDAGLTPDGTRYLVLEYVEGEPIDTACDARCLGIDERLQLFLQVCEAVSYGTNGTGVGKWGNGTE